MCAFAGCPTSLASRVEGRPAGEGQLDIPGLLKTLGHPGRDLCAILELWPAPESTTAETLRKESAWVEQSIRYLRALIPD
jgi:L-ribulose-5-phosphate 3-epimerase UlaE